MILPPSNICWPTSTQTTSESPEEAKARYLETLKTFKPHPTAIVNSGNGINVLWKLAEPNDIGRFEPVKDKKGKLKLAPEAAAIVEDAEGRSKAMMIKLGSVAGTQNIDRILRLPGTINSAHRS